MENKLIPIASGKGGVGKSVLCANLGICLGRAGRTVILVDLDLGGSNLHSYLGMKNRHQGIGNFVSSKAVAFSSIICPTEYSNVSFIPGDALVPGMANLSYGQRRSIINNLMKLEADYVLADLGSGSGFGTVDFFLMSDHGLIVATPQIASILNAYNFLKSLVFRDIMRAAASSKKIGSYFKGILAEKRPGQMPGLGRICEDISAIDSASGALVQQRLGALRPMLVLNMAETAEDAALGESLRDLTRKNLGLELGCLGMVCTDQAVDDSVKNLRPLAVAAESSPAARQIDRMAQKISQSEGFPDMPLDLSMYRDSFELARIEADYDRQERVAATQAGGEPQGLGNDELIAVIAAQQQRIQELQGTIRMLTMQKPQR